MGGLRHGFGIYHWADGSWWCGFWAEGLRDGAGLYMRADGAIMTGIWSNDSLQE
jgi:1-phosphatidylinositol-4-phosphate 5-kinase